MGGSLNWEYINGQVQTDSLDLLGDAIEHISQKYAESVLSGAGIDIDSKFGQMLANNIIQAQKASTQLEVLDDQIDSCLLDCLCFGIVKSFVCKFSHRRLIQL